MTSPTVLRYLGLALTFAAGGFAKLAASSSPYATLYGTIATLCGSAALYIANLAPSLSQKLAIEHAATLPGAVARVQRAVDELALKRGVVRVPPFSVLALALLGVLLAGCISSAPIVPVTTSNAGQVSTCQGIAEVHNGVVVGDFVFGGAAPVLASVGAAIGSSSPGAKTDLSIASAIAGGVALAGAGIAAYSASDFANSQCSAVVGPLPVMPAVKPAPPPSMRGDGGAP